MELATLGKQGIVELPAKILKKHDWQHGQRFEVLDTEWGVMLRPFRTRAKKTLSEVAGILAYQGEAKTLEDMENGILEGIKNSPYDSR